MRTYSARLIGRDPALVLHGGGNTSVKTAARAITGEAVSVICVKGSGWDLETIEPAGHPAVKLDALLKLRAFDQLSDENMVNALRLNMLDMSGPTPSVETLLHAFLPHKFIDHTHADSVLSITNQPDGEKKVLDWAGGRLSIVPYVMPGFALSKLAAAIYEKNPDVEGLVLLKHGFFTFGPTARESYERMIAWVNRAEKFLARAKPFSFTALSLSKEKNIPEAVAVASNMIRGVCHLRRPVPRQSDPLQRMIVRHRASPAILRFVNSEEARVFSQRGPATPDHVIRTKARPVVLPPVSLSAEKEFQKSLQRAVDRFKKDYEQYFERQIRKKAVKKTPLDPLPRILLVPGLGIFSIAAAAKAADIALDIYEHTIDVIEKAARIGSYEALPEGDLFDMEYWSLEQAKLGKGEERPFSRRVVWISGAASGIGLATAAAFADLGAHVFLTDSDEKKLAEAMAGLKQKQQGAMAVCDVTDARRVRETFRLCSAAFGGVDIVVSNAGIAPVSDIAVCPDELLRKSFEINFFAHQSVAQAAMAIFQRQRLGGVLLFNASKSAFNPGAGFGPYALPKAGVVALMRQYAVEGGAIGVRSNAVNADRVNTALYSGGLLERRAKARGLTLQDYLSGNLVAEEVFAEDVAQAFIYLAQARKTTGAVIPVDGGNAAAFPR